MVDGEAHWHFTVTLGTQGHLGYCRVDETSYESFPLDRYRRNVNRWRGDESVDLDLDSLPETDPDPSD